MGCTISVFVFALAMTKLTMSRFMVLEKGMVVNKFCFSLIETAIPSMTEQPKNLWKFFDSTPPPFKSPTKTLKPGSPRLFPHVARPSSQPQQCSTVWDQ